MENKRLKRVFDRVRLSQEREEAMLADLLMERKEEAGPVRSKRKLTAVLAAAAAMLLSVCALAVSEPTWRDSLTVLGTEEEAPRTEVVTDPALLDAFGAEPEDAPLLRSGVFTPDASISDKSGTLKIRQAWADRYHLAILWDFTAPEGTALDGDGYQFKGRTPANGHPCAGWRLSDADGQTNHGCGTSTWADFWVTLDDEDPEDHHLTILQLLHVRGGGPLLTGGEYRFQFKDLRRELFPGSEIILSGEWSGAFSLPETDIGENFLIGQTATIEGKDVTLEAIYISPVTVAFELGEGAVNLRRTDYRAASTDWREHIFLLTADGERIAMQQEQGYTGPDLCAVAGVGRYSCRPERMMDPADITAVELFGQTIQLPREK